MSSRLKRTAPYACLLAVVLWALLVRFFSPATDSSLSALLNDASVRDNSLLPETDATLHFLIDDADHMPWRINQPLAPGVLNIAMFSGRRAQVVPAYRELTRTLAWIPKYHTILIDVDYLKELAISIADVKSADQWDNPYERDYEYSEIYNEFLIWIVGHELGHVHNHDSAMHFWSEWLTAPAKTSSVDQARETKADLFAAERISRSPEYVDTISRLLFGILNEELEARMPKPNKQGPLIVLRSQDAVNVLSTGTHPEFIVRAARILANLKYRPNGNTEFAVWSKDLLDRIRSSPTTACTAVIETSPVPADLVLQQDRALPIIYWTPAKLLLGPGRYTLSLRAQGYLPATKTLEITDCGHVAKTTVNLQPEEHSAPALTPEQEFANMRYESFKRVDNARYLAQQGRWKASEWEINKALENDRAWSEPLFLGALLSAHRGTADDAIEKWREAISTFHNQSEAYEIDNYRLSDVFAKKKEIESSLRTNPHDAITLRSLVELWLLLGQIDKAEPIVRKLRVSPGQCQDQLNYANFVLIKEHRIDRLVRIKQSACARVLDSADMLTAAKWFQNKNDVRAAGQWYWFAYHEDADEWEPLVQFLRQQRRYSVALSVAKAVVRHGTDNPDYTDALNMIGQIQLNLGQPVRAERWFRRALKSYLNNVEALVGLAHAAEQRGRWKEAKKFCQQAVRENTWFETQPGWVCMGEADAHAANREAAIRDYENALWLSPRSPGLCDKLRELYQESGDTERGRTYLFFYSSLMKDGEIAIRHAASRPGWDYRTLASVH